MPRAYGKIKVARAGAVETITLSYPERRNAIGPQMTNELLWALEDASSADDVRAVVITGAGKAFCAGGDFQQMTGGAEGEALPPKGDYADLLLAMTRFEKPIVAKVNGHAMGGGLGLVAASTFAIASAEAQLGTPEIQVGLFPMMIMAVLARLVPRRRLLKMMLLGEKLAAGEAAAIFRYARSITRSRAEPPSAPPAALPCRARGSAAPLRPSPAAGPRRASSAPRPR